MKIPITSTKARHKNQIYFKKFGYDFYTGEIVSVLQFGEGNLFLVRFSLMGCVYQTTACDQDVVHYLLENWT